MLTIPLQQEPNQSLNVTLNSQSVDILLYMTDYGLFADIKNNGSYIATGVLCLDMVPIIRNEYLGFVGNIVFVDTQGNDDPTFDALGTRYVLSYMDASEYELLF